MSKTGGTESERISAMQNFSQQQYHEAMAYPKGDSCYKCHQKGHKAINCPLVPRNLAKGIPRDNLELPTGGADSKDTVILMRANKYSFLVFPSSSYWCMNKALFLAFALSLVCSCFFLFPC